MSRSHKRFAWILVFFLWASQSYAATSTDTAAPPVQPPPGPSSQDVPSVEFPEVTHAFGQVMEGAEVTHDFKVRNSGTSVLRIDQVRPG